MLMSAYTQSRPRIALFGLFGAGNLGNEGSLEALIASLRRIAPAAELVCICPRPDVVEAEHGIKAIAITGEGFRQKWLRVLNKLLGAMPGRLRDVARVYRLVGQFDAVLVPGTGILDDMGVPPFGMPYAMFKWFGCARARGVATGFVSIGAGPIHNKLSRFFMLGSARRASYRSYRDQISKDFMLRHDVPADADPVFPDIAFQLPTPVATPKRDGAAVIGVGVMSYFGWSNSAEKDAAIYDTYRAKIVALTVWLLEQGHDVRLIVGQDTDDRALRDVQEGVAVALPSLPAPRMSAAPTRNLHDIMAQMVDTDVVVATRFHNVVCALKLAKPTISLGYAEKNDVLMQDFGLGAYCQHVETFDLDMVKRQIAELLRDRDIHAPRLAAKTASYREALARQEQALSAKLFSAEAMS